ncbi:MAG: T9SS type A sorting domain-containing protein [Bacteroidetes bacterium]|nr:T9SS type A sorting domain-containing protein [Bacteroidota bacterium]
MRNYFILFFALAFHSLSAQSHFTRQDTVSVYINSLRQPFAWAGGMNSCQYSNIDLNQDGIMDLFIFDRQGNKITTYVSNGTPDSVDYVFAPQYISAFPRMHDWAILRDYNCDGKMDIFTSNLSKIELYKNVSTVAGGLAFQLVTTGIKTDITPNSTDSMAPLNVSWIDVPAIRDIDGDGDLDVLTYGVGGTQVEFHHNMSKELYGVCDSVNSYTLETLCWGEFYESQLDATITLNVSCSNPPAHNDASHDVHLHNGSCLECINTDGDNDQDVIIGDLANPNINYIRNAGTNTFAHCDYVDPLYPSYDTTMYLNIFGCGYHLDVDNDGKNDVVFSPNGFTGVENYHSSWLYHNTGRNDSVRLHFIENNFIQGHMIDVGEGSYPRLFDFDHDGDLDLFIGNRGYYDISGFFPTMISLYKNTGTNAAPVFDLITKDFAHITQQDTFAQGAIPTFGDIDGDGDQDMIVGDVNGFLNLYRKDPGNDSNFVLTTQHIQNIDVGSYAIPQLVDVDRDGLLDLLVGEQSGNVNYYRNTGTNAVPFFTLITPLFGNVIVTQAGFTTGYSAPWLYDDNGNYILFCGSERGFLYRFDNVDGNLAGNFTLTDSLYVSSYEGGRIVPCVADLNNDSLFDVVIGNYAGGVSLFYGDNNVGIAEHPPLNIFFSAYPNPANETLTIETADLPSQDEFITLTDISGKIVLSQKILLQKTMLGISSLADGMYFCTISNAAGFRASQKLIIAK